MLAALAALLVWQFVPESAGSKRTVAVLGFKNQTGDSGLDYLREAIPNLLITSLEQSTHLRITSWERLKDLLKQAGRDPAAAVFDEEAGFEVCRRHGIEALVVGSYVKAGETFVTDVKVLDAATRDSLKSASARGEGVASILKSQIDEISREVGRGIGKPLLKIEAPARPIMDLTTGSMEAYNYFLRGRSDFEKYYFADARKFLEKAIAVDPEFAIAYMVLSEADLALLDFNGREEALKNAFRFSAKASEKERLYIAALHAHAIERDEGKRFGLLRELVRKYPEEKYAHFELGRYHEGRLEYAEAVAALEKAIALDPEFGFAINQLAYDRAKMGQYDEALRLFERYAAINPGDANPLDSIGELYVRMGKLDLAEAKYREALEMRPDFFGSCASLSYVACSAGGLRRGLSLARRTPTDDPDARGHDPGRLDQGLHRLPPRPVGDVPGPLRRDPQAGRGRRRGLSHGDRGLDHGLHPQGPRPERRCARVFPALGRLRGQDFNRIRGPRCRGDGLHGGLGRARERADRRSPGPALRDRAAPRRGSIPATWSP